MINLKKTILFSFMFISSTSFGYQSAGYVEFEKSAAEIYLNEHERTIFLNPDSNKEEYSKLGKKFREDCESEDEENERTPFSCYFVAKMTKDRIRGKEYMKRGCEFGLREACESLYVPKTKDPLTKWGLCQAGYYLSCEEYFYENHKELFPKYKTIENAMHQTQNLFGLNEYLKSNPLAISEDEKLFIHNFANDISNLLELDPAASNQDRPTLFYGDFGHKEPLYRILMYLAMLDGNFVDALNYSAKVGSAFYLNTMLNLKPDFFSKLDYKAHLDQLKYECLQEAQHNKEYYSHNNKLKNLIDNKKCNLALSFYKEPEKKELLSEVCKLYTAYSDECSKFVDLDGF